jgi:hypothetical protein
MSYAGAPTCARSLEQRIRKLEDDESAQGRRMSMAPVIEACGHVTT